MLNGSKIDQTNARADSSSSQDNGNRHHRAALAAIVAFIAISILAACGSANQVSSFVAHELPAQRNQNTIVFIGDSITYRWTSLPQQAQPLSTINAGISGQTAEQVAMRFANDAIDTPAHTVVILAGTNDILKQTLADPSYVEQMAIEAKEAGMKVIVGLIPPTEQGLGDSMQRVDEYNSGLSEWCQSNNFPVADYFHALDLSDDFVDGIHPNANGYKKMWAVIEPILDSIKAAT